MNLTKSTLVSTLLILLLVPPATLESSTVTLRIEALIDGVSRLEIWGNSAQWHHIYYCVPGRIDDQDEPTFIGGVPWMPAWPEEGCNRFCDCYSDVFTGVLPNLAPLEQSVALHIIEARDTVQITEQPTFANAYAVVIEFDDDSPLGGAWYTVEIEFITNTVFTDGFESGDTSAWSETMP